jgi:hypothetical protein
MLWSNDAFSLYVDQRSDHCDTIPELFRESLYARILRVNDDLLWSIEISIGQRLYDGLIAPGIQ